MPIKFDVVLLVEISFTATGLIHTIEDSINDRSQGLSRALEQNNAFAYRFFERRVHAGPVMGSMPKENYSGYHYIDGKVYSFEDVLRQMPDDDTLIENMKSGNWTHVVQCNNGIFRPFFKGDIIVSSKNA